MTARAELDAAMTAITIELPWPDRALSPNAGNANPYAHRAARKAYRELAAWEWLIATHGRIGVEVGKTLTPPTVATITFYYTKRRKFDRDNHIAMLKPVWDGAQDAGVIVGDDFEVFSIGEVTFVRGTERGVTVTLEETT